jgi:crotonobetainyl-CoA:carnitine CoA-transferase CaiB-like acyl-CoA transferase
MEPNQVQPGPRHQRRQPLHEFERRHHEVRGAVAPGGLELEHHLPGRVGLYALVGQSGARDVAAQADDPDWLTDARFATDESRGIHRDILSERMARWCRPRDTETVVTTLGDAMIPAAPVLSPQRPGEPPIRRQRHAGVGRDAADAHALARQVARVAVVVRAGSCTWG